MLAHHFDNLENILLANLGHTATLGHPVDKGTAREIFVKEFLGNHLGANIGIGNGEIIDANSQAEEKRYQHDIIIYRKDYPKLHFASGVDIFLAESVVATIEVKSTLDKAGLEQAIGSAYATKQLKRSFANIWALGSSPPAIRNYVFAYKGPEQIITVSNWFREIHKQLGVPPPKLGGLNTEQALDIASPALDGLIVLQKGALHIRNIELIPQGSTQNTDGDYFVNDAPRNNLLVFFLWLTAAINQVAFSVWDYSPYLPKG